MNLSVTANLSSVHIHWTPTDTTPTPGGTMAYANMTDDEYLLLKMGPRRKDMLSVVCLLVIYSFIFVTGIVGNVCTAIVIVRNRYMQTTTDYYLCSLAISDILILVSCKYGLLSMVFFTSKPLTNCPPSHKVTCLI